MKIVVAEPISTTLDELIAHHNKDWVVYEDRPADKTELIKRIGDAEVASSYSVHYDGEVFEACPNLKYVAIPAVGASFFVDMEAAKRHGVTVMNCPGYNAQAVAELAVGFMLDLLRFVVPEHAKIAGGAWNFTLPKGHLLQGKTVGLIGYGNVGKTIEYLLNNWDVTVLHVDSASSATDIDGLASKANVVVVCCPITDETRHMLDERRFALMKSGVVIINVGRGGVIDEDALYKHLVEGHVAGAGLDVFEQEPVTDEPIASIERFAKLPNVICTPHLAGTSEESREVLGQMIYDNLVSCENGKPQNTYKD